LVEALVPRHELQQVAQVPFSENRRRISPGFADAREVELFWVEANFRVGPQCALDADADVVTAGEQRRAGRGANGLGDVEIGELDSLLREAVDVGRGRALGAVAGEVAVAHVVDEHDDDVGRTIVSRGAADVRQGEDDDAHTRETH
jgi:hypothetical protein